MKKIVCLISVLCIAVFTGCSNSYVSDSIETTKQSVATEELPPENLEVQDIKDFAQLVEFYETDPYYNPETMRYEIYLEKVMVASKEGEKSDKTIVVVCGKATNIEKQKSQEMTIAAKCDFVDSYRSDGPILNSKTEWWNNGTPYSADSIISAALKKAGISSEDDLQLYEKVVLITTFENN